MITATAGGTLSTPGTDGQAALAHSYLFLRRAIGIIGLALPFVLIIGKLLIDGGGLLGSVSGYYYTDMRDVFVGSMCAVGVFLLAYRGHDLIDDVVADIAGVAAIGVALFPTTPAGPRTHTQQLVGDAHVVFAAVFFLSLAYFCLVRFRRSADPRPTGRKAARNGIYLGCGVIILVCLVSIVVVGLALHGGQPWHAVLWLESAATVAFGVAWFVKGETLLRDRAPEPSTTHSATV